MTILIALVFAVGVMAAIGVVLLIVGLRVSRVVGTIGGPFSRTSMLSKVTFGVLWLLILSAAFGMLGA